MAKISSAMIKVQRGFVNRCYVLLEYSLNMSDKYLEDLVRGLAKQPNCYGNVVGMKLICQI